MRTLITFIEGGESSSVELQILRICRQRHFYKLFHKRDKSVGKIVNFLTAEKTKFKIENHGRKFVANYLYVIHDNNGGDSICMFWLQNVCRVQTTVSIRLNTIFDLNGRKLRPLDEIPMTHIRLINAVFKPSKIKVRFLLLLISVFIMVTVVKSFQQLHEQLKFVFDTIQVGTSNLQFKVNS